MDKQDLKDFTFKELEGIMAALEEPEYRAGQIFDWLYKKGAVSLPEMKNLPRGLITRLGKKYCVGTGGLVECLESVDGTEKFLYRLSGGNLIETVLIYAKNRKTACLSTQVGCKFGCSFCASGRRGFVRNLTPAEIINQILFPQRGRGHTITNYVFMGMGEPLDNYANVVRAIKIMNTPQGLDIGARRITVSTCGLVPGIEQLAGLGIQVNLSVSLHAVNNKLRNGLVPANRRYPLEELIPACERFIEKTGRLITLEYILIKGRNDSRKDSAELAKIARKLRAKVNLIPCSPVPGLSYQPPGEKGAAAFLKELVGRKVKATLRESRGKDIQAACGQLAGGGERSR